MPEKNGRRRARLMAIGAAAILAIVPGAAFAQGEGETPAPLVPLEECRAETDPAARLACYDRVAGEILAASEAGDLRVVDREEIKKTRRSLFGFSLPDLGIFGGDGDEDEDRGEAEEQGFDVLNTTIAGVAGNYRTGYLITTAEGAVWRLEERPVLSPKVGQPVEIRKAALSSYFVRVNGQNGVKGVRVR